MMNSSDIFASIEPIAAEYFDIGKGSKDPIFSRIAKTTDTDKAVELHVEYGGTGPFVEKDEGEPFTEDRIHEGWQIQFMAKTYGSIVSISREALDDTRHEDIKRPASAMGRAAAQTPNYLYALFLDRAFTATAKVVGDQLSLCNTAHTTPRGGTYSNMFSVAYELGEEGLEQAFINMALMPARDDMINGVEARTLVIPTALGPLAWKLKNTNQSIGSAVNDKSYVAAKKWNVVEYPHLGSGTRWFLTTDVTEDGEGLFFKFRKRVEFMRDQVGRTMQALFIGWFRCFYGVLDARGIFGSNAA